MEKRTTKRGGVCAPLVVVKEAFEERRAVEERMMAEAEVEESTVVAKAEVEESEVAVIEVEERRMAEVVMIEGGDVLLMLVLVLVAVSVTPTTLEDPAEEIAKVGGMSVVADEADEDGDNNALESPAEEAGAAAFDEVESGEFEEEVVPIGAKQGNVDTAQERRGGSGLMCE